MPPKKSLRFALSEDEKRSSAEQKAFRKSQFPAQKEDGRKSSLRQSSHNDLLRMSRVSSIASPRFRSSARLTQMFANINVRRDRQSTVFRPLEIYLPTFRLESKKPFDPRIVEDFLQSRIKNRLDEQDEFKFDDPKSMDSLTRSLSGEILSQVKIFEFDRYKIFVAVTIGQKKYQGFTKSVGVLWDVENDSMASYVYERNNVFALFNVFGVYFD